MQHVQFIKDEHVDEEMNKNLISILSTCFPHEPTFRTQRFFKEMPRYRWIVNDGSKIVAHAAMHDKIVKTDIRDIRICGVAEVCVHPEYRGQGLVRKLLVKMHDFAKEQGIEYSVLFGDAKVYASSGYAKVDNIYSILAPETSEPSAMVCLLSTSPWPTAKVLVQGPLF